jgi:hypothetical protein
MGLWSHLGRREKWASSSMLDALENDRVRHKQRELLPSPPRGEQDSRTPRNTHDKWQTP